MSRSRLPAVFACLCIAFAAAEVGAQNYCEKWKTPEAIGNIGTRGLDETSGVVASQTQKDVLWMHNDSGDEARIFALSLKGKYLGQWKLEGVEATDWEDISTGPCADGSPGCLWIADTGNNTLLRETLTIYRVPEPEVDRSKPPAKHIIDRVDTIQFRYPDGERYDAEALMVADDGTFWMVSKEALGAKLFRGKDPKQPEAIVTLRQTGSRDGLRLVTAGDMTRDGTRFVLRGYDWAMVFVRVAGAKPGEIFDEDTIGVPLAVEPQGEAIAYVEDGSSLITTSEERHQPIFRYDCEAFAQPTAVEAVAPATKSAVKYPESQKSSDTWLSCSSSDASSTPLPVLICFVLRFFARRWHL